MKPLTNGVSGKFSFALKTMKMADFQRFKGGFLQIVNHDTKL